MNRPTLNLRVPVLAAALALSTAVAVEAPAANAGIAQFRDSVGMLSADDLNYLRATAGRYSFDVRILTEASFADRFAFDQYVGQQVSQPNLVVVGIDPMHRRTSVHFGRGVGIARSQFSLIENAGDPYFRAGQYRMGIEAILARAQTAVGTAPVRGSTQDGRGSALLVVVVLLAVGGALAFALRRRSTAGGYPIDPNNPYRYNGYGMPTTGYPPNGGYPPGGGYGYAPPAGHSTGTVVGAGLAGAAVGGLAGYAMGRSAGEHHGDYNHGYSGASSSGYDNGGNYDAGGSTSGWDSGGGGDYGGGGDFGGGSDGGGGGGDW